MSIEITGIVQHEAWGLRIIPPTEAVRPGLWSVPVPIPNNPLRYVNVYVLELEDGIAVIDAGWPVPEAWDALVAGLAVTGHVPADVRCVLVTHAHSDHYGLAPRLRAESGAWVGLHEADVEFLRPADLQGLVDGRARWLLDRGVPHADAGEMAGRIEDYTKFFTLEPPDRLLSDGERPLAPACDLTAVWTPGHTPGHLSFYLPSAGLFLSGDHVLPRITPNITAHNLDADGPLDAYLDSLRLVAGLDVTEVLPAHEYRFSGLAGRAEDLIAHHHRRLLEVELILAERPGATTWEVTKHTLWSRNWEEMHSSVKRSAVGETLARLLSLRAAGKVWRTQGDQDAWSLIARVADD